MNLFLTGESLNTLNDKVMKLTSDKMEGTLIRFLHKMFITKAVLKFMSMKK